jgi:hypothetical protein
VFVSLRTLVAIASLLFAFPAVAGSGKDESFSRPGWYIGPAVAGQFYLLQDDVEKKSAGLLTVSNTVGFNIRGGYRLLSWLALEGIYEYAPGFSLETAQSIDLSVIDPSLPNVSKGTELVGINGNTLTGNVKLLLPIWRVHPYLNLGLGASFINIEDRFDLVDESRTALAGRLAFGGDIYITKNLLVFLEVSSLLTTFDVSDPTASQNLSLLYYLSPQGGLQWRF